MPGRRERRGGERGKGGRWPSDYSEGVMVRVASEPCALPLRSLSARRKEIQHLCYSPGPCNFFGVLSTRLHHSFVIYSIISKKERNSSNIVDFFSCSFFIFRCFIITRERFLDEVTS